MGCFFTLHSLGFPPPTRERGVHPASQACWEADGGLFFEISWALQSWVALPSWVPLHAGRWQGRCSVRGGMSDPSPSRCCLGGSCRY